MIKDYTPTTKDLYGQVLNPDPTPNLKMVYYLQTLMEELKIDKQEEGHTVLRSKSTKDKRRKP